MVENPQLSPLTLADRCTIEVSLPEEAGLHRVPNRPRPWEPAMGLWGQYDFCGLKRK